MSKKITFDDKFRVPSIEHAAEAIGNKGCKINALRLLTKAFIISPHPGSDPVFIIKAPTIEALRICQTYIQNACDNFDKIRLEKRNIIVPRGGVVCTLRVWKQEVNKIIGSKGSTVQDIAK